MLLHIPGILGAKALQECRGILARADWADGRITAGSQSAQVKRNLQLPDASPEAIEARALVMRGLQANAMFFTAALPKRFFPPLFNRYEGGMGFGDHIDNAVRTVTATGERVRTDLSATLFLCEPQSYDGGELVVEDTLGPRSVKLPAGDLILYPASTVHRVEPVTRGTRLASFFWVESMVREDERRRLLFDLDMAVLGLRQAHGETEQAIALTGCYHNLLRMWADA